MQLNLEKVICFRFCSLGFSKFQMAYAIMHIKTLFLLSLKIICIIVEEEEYISAFKDYKVPEGGAVQSPMATEEEPKVEVDIFQLQRNSQIPL